VRRSDYTPPSSVNRMFLALLVTLLAWSSPAHAQGMALDPQNRLHLGLNVLDGPAGFGVTGGFDSRLTRFIALDIGAFASPVAIARDFAWADDAERTTPEYYRLRHGVYATPGIRIPHPQPRTWAWEVFLRAGGGVVWAANLAPNAPDDTDTYYSIRPDPAGVVGGDALVRFGRFGARIFGKAWMFDIVQTSPTKTFFVARPQYGVEALVQW
jgi:hypothetical protein